MKRRILVAVALVAAGAGVWAARDRAHGPVARPNILVFDIDTLRDDRVGAMRGGRAVTPEIDALIARGTRFTHSSSASGWTIPALVSLLSGRAPAPLPGERRLPAPRKDTPDLPHVLGLYGYHSEFWWGPTLPGTMAAALSTAPDVSESVRQNQPPPTEALLTAIPTLTAPFFVWVHTVDLQSPGAMPGPLAFVDAHEPAATSYAALYHALLRTHPEPEAQDLTLAHYDSVLHAADADIGRVLEALDDAGHHDDTLIVVLSDHGEDLFTHGTFDHGLLYESTLRVPLILVDPDQGPHRVDAEVQTIDLAPTLLDRLGIPIAAPMIGQSLLPFLRGGSGAYTERPLFALSEPCHAALRTPSQKLIVRMEQEHRDRNWGPAGNGVVVPVEQLGTFTLPDCAEPGKLLVELYDLQNDPEERHNLVVERAASVAPALTALLDRMREQAASRRHRPDGDMTPEAKAALQNQGYWGLLGDDAADPK